MSASCFAGQNRLAYLDALRPPERYELEAALGTTYSVDLEALVAALVALSGLGGEGMEASLSTVVRALHRDTRGRVLLIAQRGRATLGTEGRPRPLFALLDRVVRDAPFDERQGSFHPKMWLVRFRGEGQDRFRLLIGSRNLTRDRSWDAGVVLEGTLGERKTRLAADVLRFVEATIMVCQLHGEPAMDRLRPGLACVEWGLPVGVREARFRIRVGSEQRLAFPDLSGASKCLVVSPFVDAVALNRLAQALPVGERLLVSTEAALLNVASSPDGRKALRQWQARTMPAVVSPAENEQATTSGDEAPEPYGLHAKIIGSLGPGQAKLWIGSANATRRGLLGPNAEALLELTGDPALLESLDRWAAVRGIPFSIPNPAKLEPATPEPVLDPIRRALSACTFLLQRDRSAAPDLLVALPGPVLPSGMTLHAGRATGGNEVLWGVGDAGVALPPCPSNEETELFQLRLATGEDEACWVVRAKADPPIGDLRDRALLQVVLGVRAFLRYLRGLLDEERANQEDGGTWRAEPASGVAGRAYPKILGEELTFEALLRACGDNPKRLAEVDEQLQRFASEGDGPTLLSSQDAEILARFHRFWKVFRQGMKRGYR